MDRYSIEETKELDDFRRYEVTYVTYDKETAEKIRAFFEGLIEEKERG